MIASPKSGTARTSADEMMKRMAIVAEVGLRSAALPPSTYPAVIPVKKIEMRAPHV